jgi:hypothetical protein
MSDTPPGFPPEDDGTEDGGGPPITKVEPCPFCNKAAHFKACPELLSFVGVVKATMPAPRLCPTCGATMTPVGVRSWVCPKQRDEEKQISNSLRLSIRATATARQPELAPF